MTKLQVDMFKKRAKSRLASGTEIFSTLSKKHLDRKCNYGGQLVIVRPTWAPFVVKAKGDHTDLGIVMEVDVKLNDSTLKILGNYWPSRSSSDGGMWGAVAKHMTDFGLDNKGEAVSDYVKQLVGNKILKHMENGNNSVIIGGDFNAGWKWDRDKEFVERGHHQFKQWAEQHGLLNDVAELYDTEEDRKVYTYKNEDRETFIDHVLNSTLNTDFVKGGCSQSMKWQKDTDHRPVWIAVKLRDKMYQGAQTHGYQYKKVRRVELDLEDVIATQALQDLMLKLTGDYEDEFDNMTVEQIKDMTKEVCNQSVKVVRHHMKRQFKGSKKMKDGWSPTYCVLCSQLDAFELIKSHLLAQGSKHRWRNESDRRVGVRKILKTWGDDADYYQWEDGKKGKLLNITGNSYSWWMLKKEYSIDEIVAEIKLIKKKMHGRKRTELRMQINQAVRLREQGRLDNKLKKLIASITEKQINMYAMETLNVSSEAILNNPADIHNNLTEWFKKWYGRNEYSNQGIHSSSDWSSFFETREGFDKFME